MAKTKYYFNTTSLTYERERVTWKTRLLKMAGLAAASMVLAGVIVFIAYSLIDSPKERQLKREIAQMRLQYDLIKSRVSEAEMVLRDLEDRDDNIYRVIFEAEPIPSSIRNAGYGGINRYKDLKSYQNSDVIIGTAEMLDRLEKKLYIQSKSFDEVFELARNKKEMLSSIPAIQPVSNKDLQRTSSGFGFRIHPVYKTRKMHWGMDFTAPTGTDIYATGDGIVKSADRKRGYGNCVVIDHGYGYETIYGHMSRIIARKGQKVKRGDVIGLVGNTGMSTAPHLHYEVVKFGKKVNPIHFFYNDLSPEEFDRMLEISSQKNQSFD
ncbi:MAG: M23 family metallopeptidase [Bacteroidia bacterium]|nr:M23 family metallopeptidase [Bacteroidia bacterium]